MGNVALLITMRNAENFIGKFQSKTRLQGYRQWWKK